MLYSVAHPIWLSSVVTPDWFDRYSKPVEESRLPRGTEARNDYAAIIGQDGMKILEAIYDDATTPQWLREIPVIETLRMAWVHQYWINDGQLGAVTKIYPLLAVGVIRRMTQKLVMVTSDILLGSVIRYI